MTDIRNIPRNIPQAQMTGECWTVQFEGLVACKTCEYRSTEDCIGWDIINTGKNSKGFSVPLGRVE